MARIPYPDPETIPENVQKLFADGPAYNIFRMLPSATHQVHGFVRFGNANFTKIGLDPRLREIAILTTARESNANYEWAHHVHIAQRCEIADEIIEAIKTYNYDALEGDDRTVAEFARSVTRDVRANDDAFKGVRDLLGETGTVELLMVIGFYNLVARFLETLEIDLEDKYENRLR